MSIRSVGLCVKANHPEAGGTVRGLAKWLTARGLDALLDEDAAELAGAPGRTREAVASAVDLLVVLGGDGTLLSVARAAGARPVPILGVNLGTLGFLTEVTHDELYAALERVLAGQAHVEPRMRLDVRAERGHDDPVRERGPDGPVRELGRWLALNDAVITAEALARMLELEAFVAGRKVTTYHADGLIAATPTGSTAYSLAAGGPILDTAMDAIILNPISPHTLTQRPLVFPGDREIEVRAHPGGSPLHLTVDGQAGMRLEDGDVVRISRSAHPALLVTSPFRTRFDILRTKLHWGER
jgi:NAD+ kinase